MNKSIAAIILTLVTPMAFADRYVETVGTLSCQVDAEGFCQLAWDSPPRGPKVSYLIEAMDPEHPVWRRIGQPLRDPVDLTKHELEGGRLYRVLACNNASRRNCISSPVYWAVFQPLSEDAIPISVDNRRGTQLQVSKGLSFKSQKQQYNIYLLYRLINGVDDMGAMPAMAPSRFAPGTHMHRIVEQGSEDEIIHYRAHETYELLRIRASQKK